MQVQPFHHTAEDYAALIKLGRLLDPEVIQTVAALQQQESKFVAEHGVVRVLGKVKDEIVASGVYWRSLLSDKTTLHFTFSVHPDHQDSSVPEHMHRYLLASIELEHPTAIVSRLKEDERYRTRLLEASKFELKMRFPRSRLDVAKLEPGAYDSLTAQLLNKGIEFITLSDAMTSDPDWQRNIWRLFTVIEQDVPTPEPAQTTPFEQYAEYYTGEWFRPDSWALAVDRYQPGVERYVGMCVVNIMPTRPNSLFAGITGVVPSHRRRKIATVLKVCSVKYAQQHGYQFIYTDNEEHNPMFDLNLQLGFEPLPAWVYYKKEMSQGEPCSDACSTLG